MKRTCRCSWFRPTLGATVLALLLVPARGPAGGTTWTVSPNGPARMPPTSADLAEARRRLLPLLQADPQDAALRFTAARLARRAGDYASARKDLAEYRRLAGNTAAGSPGRNPSAPGVCH